MLDSLKTIKRLFVGLVICLSIFSCKKEKEIKDIDIKKSEHFIDLSEATAIARVLQFSKEPLQVEGELKENPRLVEEVKEIDKVTEVPDSEGNPSFYIINYKKTGFIIISADDRIEPVRAFSSTDHFSLKEKEYPHELVNWLRRTAEIISETRLLNQEQTEGISKQWKSCSIQQTISNRLISEVETCDGTSKAKKGNCISRYVVYTPRMSTTWGQTGAYNDRAPNLGCSGDGRAPTGCVATAMAQIMNFHESPARYRWNSMPDNSGTASTARLMRDIGNAVNMNWGCNGSGADTKGEAASSFKDDFGYSSATYKDYNESTVKAQIRARRPVLLRGGRNDKSCFWFFCVNKYVGGHAWVCDGYKSLTYCSSGKTSTFLHMNWGWNGSSNGYYSNNGWNPGSSSFNYQRGMVYNIRP